MPHLVDHAARFRRVWQLHRVPDAAQPHSLHGNPLRLVEADGTADQCDLHRFGSRSGLFLLGCLGCALLRGGHHYAPTSSASSLPRYRATSDGSLRSINPLNVARTTLCGFADPSDLVSTFWIPADSTTARTAPPAIRPVPSGAGLSSTLPEPNLPTT